MPSKEDGDTVEGKPVEKSLSGYSEEESYGAGDDLLFEYGIGSVTKETKEVVFVREQGYKSWAKTMSQAARATYRREEGTEYKISLRRRKAFFRIPSESVRRGIVDGTIPASLGAVMTGPRYVYCVCSVRCLRTQRDRNVKNKTNRLVALVPVPASLRVEVDSSVKTAYVVAELTIDAKSFLESLASQFLPSTSGPGDEGVFDPEDPPEDYGKLDESIGCIDAYGERGVVAKWSGSRVVERKGFSGYGTDFMLVADWRFAADEL